MGVNKNEKMWEYLRHYPKLEDFLRFNSTLSDDGAASIQTDHSETWEKRFLHGHGIKRYDFTLIMIKQFDTGTSMININELFDVEEFMKWIDEQNRLRNYPDFGDDVKILSVENLQNMPTLAAVDNDTATAKYMFACRVRYAE